MRVKYFLLLRWIWISTKTKHASCKWYCILWRSWNEQEIQWFWRKRRLEDCRHIFRISRGDLVTRNSYIVDLLRSLSNQINWRAKKEVHNIRNPTMEDNSTTRRYQKYLWFNEHPKETWWARRTTFIWQWTIYFFLNFDIFVHLNFCNMLRCIVH